MQTRIFFPSLFLVFLAIIAQRTAREVSSPEMPSDSTFAKNSAASDIVEASVEVIDPSPVDSWTSREFQRQKRKADGNQNSNLTPSIIPNSVFTRSTNNNGDKMDEHEKQLDRYERKSSELLAAEGDDDEEDDEDEEIHENGKRNSDDNFYSEDVDSLSSHSHQKRDGNDQPIASSSSSHRVVREGPKIWDQWGKWSSCTVSCGIGPTEPKVWDQWGKWSCCSASCGAGKITRWRHCTAGGCASGEKEAQLKACQIKSC